MENKKTKDRWNKQSSLYNLYECPFEILLFKKWRKAFLASLEGGILEVGVGTGKNLPYYNSKAKIVGIDISDGMVSQARKLVENKKLNNVKLLVMDAQKLEFNDKSFDYVIATCVFCSIPDPVQALVEIKRVLKPNGKVILIEHVLSNHKIIAFFENLLNPIHSYLSGVNINRDTMQNILMAGLNIKEMKNLAFFDVFRKFILEKD